MGFGESVVHWIQRFDYGVLLPAMSIDPDNPEPIYPFLRILDMSLSIMLDCHRFAFCIRVF